MAKFVKSQESVAREEYFLDNHVHILSQNILTETPNEQTNLCGENLREYEEYFRDITNRNNIIDEILKHGRATTVDGTLINFHQNFVLKSPNPENLPKIGAKAKIRHEAFVGLRCMNKLREQGVYNFVWTHFFHTKNGKPYLLLENIRGETLKSSFAKLTHDELTSICNQLYCALTMAHEQFGFTHYDLHFLNILLVKVSETPFHLKYHIDGEDVFVASPGILAVIIDYEASYVEVDGMGHGAPLSVNSWDVTEKINRYTDRSFPQSDIYRFMFSISHSIIDATRFLSLWLAPHIEEELRKTGLTINDYIASRYAFITDTPELRKITPLEMFQELGMLLELPVSHFEYNVASYLQCQNETITVVRNPYSSPFIDKVNKYVDMVLHEEVSSVFEIIDVLDLLRERTQDPREKIIIKKLAKALVDSDL